MPLNSLMLLVTLLTLANMLVLGLMWRSMIRSTTPDAGRWDQALANHERLERMIREESGRSREDARLTERSQREELSSQLRSTQQIIQQGLEEIRLNQRKDASESTAQLLQHLTVQFTELVQTQGLAFERQGEFQRERLDHVATHLSSLTERLEKAQSGLRETVELRLEGMRHQQAQSLQGIQEQLSQHFEAIRAGWEHTSRTLNESTQLHFGRLGGNLSESIQHQSEAQKDRLESLAKILGELTQQNQIALDTVRKTLEERLDLLRQENTQKLEAMRKTVDEQLQGTLEKRLGESFRLVSERLEQVHKGLGEMQSLANGVGDLKRVLTNVKTRGTWGEVQLGNLLEQILTPDQFLREAQTKPGSQERVEFAIRMPGKGDGDQDVLLPVDAKFPQEDYDRLQLAAEQADIEGVELASRQLAERIRLCAKDIYNKYINPPLTTDFAFLFLPTEGLYAEVLRRPGFMEQIQREFRVTITGPTTFAATLNALRMGFRSLAIQKRSSEVWQILEAVKTEFGKYGEVLDKVQKKLHEASKSIDDVGIRRRAIDRQLRAVGTLSDQLASDLLGLDAGDVERTDSSESSM